MDPIAAPAVPSSSDMKAALLSLQALGAALTVVLASLFTAVLYFLKSPRNALRRRHPVVLVGNEANSPPVSGRVKMTVMEMIRTRCPSLHGSKAYFEPVWWLIGGHLQTCWCIGYEFFRPEQTPYTRHLLRTVDGGTISLDVFPPFEGPDDDTPILFVLHGLTGSTQESYVRDTVAEITRSKVETGKGFRVVGMNFRGCDVDTPVTSPRLYHAGETDDTRTALLFLSQSFPKAALYGLGFSMGACTIACYLGEQGANTPLKGVVCVSNPWNWTIATDYIERGPLINNWFYGPVLADALLTMFKNSRYAFERDERISMRDVYSRRYVTIRWFDDRVTSPAFGFKDAWDYYYNASSEQHIDRIKVPHLSIHSKDDPMVAHWNLPYDEAKKSSHVVMATTQGGGHVGWFGPSKRKGERYARWFATPAREFVEAIHELDPEPASPPGALPVDAKGFIRSSELPDRVGYKPISGEGLMTARIYNRTAHAPIFGS